MVATTKAVAISLILKSRRIRELANSTKYRNSNGDVTQDWGFADPSKNSHYRGYGQDFDGVLAARFLA